MDKILSEKEQKKVRALVNFFLPGGYDREFLADSIIIHAWETETEHISREYVRFKCITAWRKMQKERHKNEAKTELDSVTKTRPLSPEEQVVLKDLIHGTIMKLSSIERRLVWLRFFAELTLDEIVDQTGLGKSQVQKILMTALYRMRIDLT